MIEKADPEEIIKKLEKLIIFFEKRIKKYYDEEKRKALPQDNL